MELEELGFGDVGLIDGERIDSTLDLRDGAVEEGAPAPEVVVLTDRRVIHLSANGRRRSAMFVSLKDVEAVEIASERTGYGGFIWGALALLVAVMLYLTWDEPVWSLLAAVAVALLGAYLVVDQMLTPATVRASFKAGASELKCGLHGPDASRGAHTFVNRLFELKAAEAGGDARLRNFAPR